MFSLSTLILVWFLICKLINLYDNINDDSNSNIDTIITAEGGGGGRGGQQHSAQDDDECTRLQYIIE